MVDVGELKILNQGSDFPLGGVVDLYVGDLLSHVLSHTKPNQVWLTVQNHPTIVAVAVLNKLGAVVVVEGVEVPRATIEAAHQQGVLLLSSSLNAVEWIRRVTLENPS